MINQFQALRRNRGYGWNATLTSSLPGPVTISPGPTLEYVQSDSFKTEQEMKDWFATGGSTDFLAQYGTILLYGGLGLLALVLVSSMGGKRGR